jgi:cytochrome o ubiquinol oxidase subunit 3
LIAKPKSRLTYRRINLRKNALESKDTQRAFLSSFYTLVGTHGLHVTFGIVWLVTLMVQVRQRGLIADNQRRLLCLSMFWHFLDVIWIGVFTFVYLMGAMR